MENIARKIKVMEKFQGDAAVYELTPPMEEDGEEIRFVVVSAVVAPFSGPETFIFKSAETGEVSDWMELNGSYRGGLSHSEALQGAGYHIVSLN